MKKVKKISLWVSLGLVIAGLIIVFFSLLMVGFDIKKLSMAKFEMHTYNITESFDKIHINEMLDDVELIVSEDESCKIVCYDDEKVYHECYVGEDNILWVMHQDERSWYEKMGFFYKESDKMKVYIPKDKYDSITVYSANGDISIPNDFTFDTAVLTTVNGQVNCSADIDSQLSAETTNGNIEIKGEVNGNIHIDTLNGKINVSNINHGKITNFATTNGSIAINGNRIDVLEMSSVNGNIKFGKLLSDKIKATTTNGDIAGTVLSEGSCRANSVNGSVNVPNRVEKGGNFVFETVNGNIEIKND